jgi:hypothetical protein
MSHSKVIEQEMFTLFQNRAAQLSHIQPLHQIIIHSLLKNRYSRNDNEGANFWPKVD